MYIILVYDVNVERVGRVCRYLKRYLPRVQNSVFEGELTPAKFEKMKAGLMKKMVLEDDSVLIWSLRDDQWVTRETVGKEKLPVSNFI